MVRYAITDRTRFSGSLSAMLEHLVRIVPSVNLIQIRERDLDAAALEIFTRQLLSACALLPNGPQILVNHRADVAVACRAHGVHLRSSAGELTPPQVRELYARAGLPAPIVSISCHTPDEVRRARDFDASLILFGPVFEKTITAAPAISGSGLDLLREACKIGAPVPVLALGGVDSMNISMCLDAGAAGVAAIRLFLKQ